MIFAVDTLFKNTADFDVAVIFVFWLVKLPKINFKNLFEIIKKTFILALGFSIPILLTFIWYFAKGALPEYLKAAFLQNVNYISSWNGGQEQSFIVKQAALLIRDEVVVVGFIALGLYNRKLSK